MGVEGVVGADSSTEEVLCRVPLLLSFLLIFSMGETQTGVSTAEEADVGGEGAEDVAGVAINDFDGVVTGVLAEGDIVEGAGVAGIVETANSGW